MSELPRDGGAPHSEDDAQLVVIVVVFLVSVAILVEVTRSAVRSFCGLS